MGDDGSEATAVDDCVAGERGSGDSLSVEEPSFVWRKLCLGLELGELGDVGSSVLVGVEEAHGLGVGWILH